MQFYRPLISEIEIIASNPLPVLQRQNARALTNFVFPTEDDLVIEDLIIDNERSSNPEQIAKSKRRLSLNISEDGFELYPNPASDKIFITYPLSDSNLTLQIYDVYGKIVIEQNLPISSGIATLDVSALIPGIYFYKLNSDNTTIKTEKLIISGR